VELIEKIRVGSGMSPITFFR